MSYLKDLRKARRDRRIFEFSPEEIVEHFMFDPTTSALRAHRRPG
ncbi:hypothetical protein BSU04_44045 [Caballeronia sordidicola]|uniref:Uncharacterized protein n=1 Tax=Caballeronia sordidicola TaxID=196367 RepID=A0A226WN62_CABSO|nr:hypothetical protein BSU04_44045 [Caballeronia sordidicola]